MTISPLNSSYDAMQTSAGNAKAQEAASFESVLENAAKSNDDKKLKESCQQFESYFLQMMYTAMRKTTEIDNNGFMPKSQAEQTFQDMLDEENSKNASKGKGMGLADMLYKQLSKHSGSNLDALK